jgi:hypothetical protein
MDNHANKSPGTCPHGQHRNQNDICQMKNYELACLRSIKTVLRRWRFTLKFRRSTSSIVQKLQITEITVHPAASRDRVSFLTHNICFIKNSPATNIDCTASMLVCMRVLHKTLIIF